METAQLQENSPHRRKRDELKSIWFVVRSAWTLVPRIHHATLLAATVIMAMTSGANVAVALLLGKLADTVGNSLPNLDNELGRQAGRTLLIMSLVYLGRELLNVVRRIIESGTYEELQSRGGVSLHWSVRLNILPSLVYSRIADSSGPSITEMCDMS